MITLSARRREDVHACISAVLRDTLAEEHARLTIKNRTASYECLLSVISALQSVVSSAVRDFSEAWTVAHIDPLMALPSELAAQCFTHLKLRDCIVVSHVSRAWRRFALAERTLWNAYEVCREVPAKTAAHALQTLLERSQPAPFSLKYDVNYSESDDHGQETTDDILDLALRNIHRMGSLTLGNAAALPHLLDPTLALSAPQLKRLTCARWAKAESLAVIPAEWGPRCVPHLRVLVLGMFSLPPHCKPFSALQKLRASLPAEAVFPGVSFSAVFPNLRILELNGILQCSLPMLTPLPPLLEALRIYMGGTREEIDYSHFLHASAAVSRLRQLRLTCAAHFSDALELFVRFSTGPWTMQIDYHSLKLDGTLHGMQWKIECYAIISFTREPQFAAHTERLGDLRLSLPLFLDLHKLGVRVLPGLHSLSLFVITGEDIEAGRAFVRAANTEPDRPGLALPALEALKLLPGDTIDLHAWLVQDAPLLLPLLLSGSALPLAAIRLRMVGIPRLLPEDRDRLLPLARRVIVQSASFPGSPELVFDAGQENPAGAWAPWSGGID